MFTCSVDQGGSGTQIFALLIRTVVVYYTQVLQVRIEGTELRKRYGKKERKKICHLFLSGKKIHSSACLCANLLPPLPAVLAEFRTA